MTRYIKGQWHQRRQHIGLCFGTIFGTLYNPLLNFINYFTMKNNHHSFYILCQLFFHLDCLKCEFHLHPVTIAWNTYPSGCKKNHKFVCRNIEAVFPACWFLFTSTILPMYIYQYTTMRRDDAPFGLYCSLCGWTETACTGRSSLRNAIPML